MKKLICLLLITLSTSTFAQKIDIVGGYFPYWRSTANVKFENYNYLYFAFVFCKEDGGLKFNNAGETAMNSFLLATKNVDSKRLISVGGTDMDKMAGDPIARKHFADTLRQFCRIHDYDGIDMDWEAIDNATDRDNFTALMKDIKAEIDSTDLEFVITVGFGNYWQQWYENEALELADFLQIMIYDQTGTWAASPYGNHASMDHFKQAEAYWVGRGFNRDELVMGLPYYGYRFDDNSGGLAEAVTFGDFLSQFPNATASDNLLIDATGHYYMNGPDLIKEKANYAIDNGFKGVFVWEIAQDNFQHDLSLDKALMEVVSPGLVAHDVNISIDNTVYPNPTTDFIHIDVEEMEVKKLSLYSSTGMLIVEQYNAQEMNLSKFTNGMYILKVELQNHQSFYKRIIKE